MKLSSAWLYVKFDMFSFVIILNGSNWSLCILHISSSFSAVHQPKNPILELLKNSLEAPSHFSELIALHVNGGLLHQFSRNVWGRKHALLVAGHLCSIVSYVMPDLETQNLQKASWLIIVTTFKDHWISGFAFSFSSVSIVAHTLKTGTLSWGMVWLLLLIHDCR